MHCMAPVTPRFLSPVPRTPLRLAPGTMTVPPPPFGVHTREKEEEDDDDDDDDDDDVTVVFLESRC